MSTAKVNICKPYLKIHIFIILMVLLNVYEVTLIWSQTDIHQQFSNGMGFLHTFFLTEIGLYCIISQGLTNVQKEIEK